MRNRAATEGTRSKNKTKSKHNYFTGLACFMHTLLKPSPFALGSFLVFRTFTFKNGPDKIVFLFHRTCKTVSPALRCSENWGS